MLFTYSEDAGIDEIVSSMRDTFAAVAVKSARALLSEGIINLPVLFSDYTYHCL